MSNDTTTNTNNLTISNVTTLDGGNYTCTVTNDAGSSSNTVTVYGELKREFMIANNLHLTVMRIMQVFFIIDWLSVVLIIFIVHQNNYS